MLKVGCRGYGMSGVTGSVGALIGHENAHARMSAFLAVISAILQNYCNLNGAKPIIVYDVGTVRGHHSPPPITPADSPRYIPPHKRLNRPTVV